MVSFAPMARKNKKAMGSISFYPWLSCFYLAPLTLLSS
jgi:hypothetical protein